MIDQWLQLLPWPELRTVLVALLAAALAHLIGSNLLRLLTRLSASLPFAAEMLRRAREPLRLLLPLFGVQAVLSSAPDDLMLIDGARRLVSLAMIAFKASYLLMYPYVMGLVGTDQQVRTIGLLSVAAQARLGKLLAGCWRLCAKPVSIPPAHIAFHI